MANQKPYCPSELEMRTLIRHFNGTEPLPVGTEMDELGEKTLNALRYLDVFLTNRKGYQRKMQLKRSIMTRMAREHGFDKEIDDAIKAKFADDVAQLPPEPEEEDDNA